MRFKGLAGLLSKVLDSWASGFLKSVLAGAGLTIGSTIVMTGFVDAYVSRIKSDVSSVPQQVLAFMSMSQMDYALSVILSAMVSRAAMNSMGLFIKKK